MNDGYGFKPDNLRKVIKERKVSYSRIGREIGVPRSVLSRCMSGQSELGLKNAVLLADYFNVSVDYIIGRPERSRTKSDREALSRQLDDMTYQIEITKLEMGKLEQALDEMKKQIEEFRLNDD